MLLPYMGVYRDVQEVFECVCLTQRALYYTYLAAKDRDGVVKVVVLHCGSGVELGKGRFNSTDGGN